MLIAALVLIAGGLVTIWVGLKSTRGDLERNWVVGIRIASTLASDEAWAAAHRASGRTLMAAGLAPVVGGILMVLFGWGRDAFAATVALTSCGMLVLLVLLAGRVADRAAKAVDSA
ncbi:MAG: SdpI family protein [Acidimicrobiia bacterium]|nr:SdpI family protein [Acidimicrobiia bacterium]MBT8214588.1 SdpI family protein [Acidimicrobiia bacterium]NNC90865.1 SdpI family protein [Acidimicrobiia bacterium]